VSAVAVLALLARRQFLVELTYYWAFTASLQAVLTPDLGHGFPNVLWFTYFLYHVGAMLLAAAITQLIRRDAVSRILPATHALSHHQGPGLYSHAEDQWLTPRRDRRA
jgi:uncharacterized membrane protein YwaF